jgi:hypothetical protein
MTTLFASARLLIAAFGAAFLVVFGISQFGHREAPTAPPLQSVRAVQPQAAHLPAIPETIPGQTSDAKARESGPSVEESAQSSAIPAFRKWAETSAALGFAHADETKGMELAKARAISMKALIQQDPASALRQALPADLRGSLPPEIAAAIEQPVQTTGMCSLRIMCNHSPDAPHGDCQDTPILLEDGKDWNAYYGAQQWRTYLGQTVGFEGVAVEGELAVQSITPTSAKSSP